MPTIGDLVDSLEAAAFTGRVREQSLFASWLSGDGELPQILNVSGRGGIGKTCLLRAFRRSAQRSGRPAILVDSRSFPHTPEGFLAALVPPGGQETIAHLNETCPLILLDTFEELGELDRYLREKFLPKLDSRVRVVIAGRLPLGRTWLEWSPLSPLVFPMPLEAFSHAESREYLGRRGLRDDVVAERIIGAVGGNPLALSLAADMALRLATRDFSRAPEWRLVVRTLVEDLLRDARDPGLHDLLEACAMVRHFDEAVLVAISGRKHVSAAFQQLCQLSAVASTEHGLALHDEVRRAVAEDLRWRHPERFKALRSNALRYYRQRMKTASEAQRQWLQAERYFLWENAVIQALLFPEGEPGQVWIEQGQPADHEDIRRIWAYWYEVVLPRQVPLDHIPEGDGEFREAALAYRGTGLRVARDRDGRVLGFSLAMPVCQETLPILDLHEALAPLLHAYWTPGELAALPATPEASNIVYLVQIVERDLWPELVAAELMRDQLGLFALGGTYLVSLPQCSRTRMIEDLGFRRIPGARNWAFGSGALFDGYVLDLTRIGVERWFEAVVSGQQPPAPLDRADLERALQDVLLHWPDDSRLAGSPLAGMLVPADLESVGQRAEALRKVILAALAKVQAHALPSQRDRYRALELAYIRKVGSHDRAAEQMSVSHTTFYRLLHRGIAGLAAAMGPQSCTGD